MLTFEQLPKQVENLTAQVKTLHDLITNLQLPKNQETEKIFTIKELATYLKVSLATIHAYKKSRVFPYYQTGRTVYFKKSEVDAALSSQSKTKNV